MGKKLMHPLEYCQRDPVIAPDALSEGVTYARHSTGDWLPVLRYAKRPGDIDEPYITVNSPVE